MIPRFRVRSIGTSRVMTRREDGSSGGAPAGDDEVRAARKIRAASLVVVMVPLVRPGVASGRRLSSPCFFVLAPPRP
jgi:hypothetical protein